MSTEYARSLAFAPLVTLIDELSREAVHAEVPRELWESALYRPLLEFTAHPGKEVRARLTRLCYALAGGRAELPLLVPLLCELLHAGSLIVDDLEDGSETRRGRPTLHRQYGLPLALNAGNFLYFVPFTLLERLPVSAQAQLAMHRRMSRTLLDCHRGQALDLGARVSALAPRDLPGVVAKTTELKTGNLVALAAALGALSAEADEARVQVLERFGRELGVGLQMLDDLGGVTSDARAAKGLEDLQLERPTWLWAWLCELRSDAELRTLQLWCRRATRDASAAHELRLRLRESVAEHGRRTVHQHLRTTLENLRAALGAHPLLHEIEREVALMERSYV